MSHQVQVKEPADVSDFRLDACANGTRDPFKRFHVELASAAGLTEAPCRDGAAIDDDRGVQPTAATL